MHAELLLPPDASSPRRGREFLARQLHAWSRQEWEVAAGLLVSELITNAVLHARTTMLLRLVLAGDTLRIELRDGSVRSPQRRSYGVDAATGRGLALVEALARDWGVEREVDGKTVWCELAQVDWTTGGLFDRLEADERRATSDVPRRLSGADPAGAYAGSAGVA